jgi:DNA-binding transcriptional LysR family regulator
MQSIRGIVNFLQTAESGTFTAAAAVLGVSAVAVGKNVAALERDLGVRLFQRSTRNLQLTEEGRILIEQCKLPMRDLEFALKSIRQRAQSPTGLVRVTCVSPFGRGILQPLLPQLADLYPKIQIELVLDSKVVDMVAEGFDIGIRVGQMLQPTLLARPIAPLHFAVVGSPSYFRANGVPISPSDLVKHKCVALRGSLADSSVAETLKCSWRLGDIKDATFATLPAALVSNDDYVLLSSAIQGQGLYFCPLPLALPHLVRGDLQIALPDWIGTGLTVFLHYPSRKNLPARVKLVVDFLLDRLRSHEDLAPKQPKDLAPWVVHAQVH